jgi:hypothetical protein
MCLLTHLARKKSSIDSTVQAAAAKGILGAGLDVVLYG